MYLEKLPSSFIFCFCFYTFPLHIDNWPSLRSVPPPHPYCSCSLSMLPMGTRSASQCHCTPSASPSTTNRSLQLSSSEAETRILSGLADDDWAKPTYESAISKAIDLQLFALGWFPLLCQSVWLGKVTFKQPRSLSSSNNRGWCSLLQKSGGNHGSSSSASEYHWKRRQVRSKLVSILLCRE